MARRIVGRTQHNRPGHAPTPDCSARFQPDGACRIPFVEKLSAQLFDKGEYALRAFPFLCGIVGLLLYPKLALRVVGPAGAVIAVALFAFSEPLIYYSSELKPYAGDIAATFAIALVGLATLDHRLSIRWAVAYGFLGFVLIQLTYAGILAAAGTGAALITIFLLDRRWAHPGSIIVLVGSWAVGAAVFILSRPGIETSQFARGPWKFRTRKFRARKFRTFPGVEARLQMVSQQSEGGRRRCQLSSVEVGGLSGGYPGHCRRGESPGSKLATLCGPRGASYRDGRRLECAQVSNVPAHDALLRSLAALAYRQRHRRPGSAIAGSCRRYRGRLRCRRVAGPGVVRRPFQHCAARPSGGNQAEPDLCRPALACR